VTLFLRSCAGARDWWHESAHHLHIAGDVMHMCGGDRGLDANTPHPRAVRRYTDRVKEFPCPHT